MKTIQRTKKENHVNGRLIFVLAVMALVILFLLYFGLFKGPRQKMTTLIYGRVIGPGEPEVTEAPVETVEEDRWNLPELDLNSWELVMANDSHRLDEDFAPPELTEIESGQSVDSRIAEPIRALLSDARAAGYTDTYFCSGYRSYDVQYQIYWNHIWNYMNEGYTQDEATIMTKLAVNPPGASEHQTGLSADILESPDQDMEPYIGGSGLMLWLEEHCTEYGFVIRYPDGKTNITGVEYEPWHLRYVGVEAAEYMTENGLCLEEFLTLYEMNQ